MVFIGHYSLKSDTLKYSNCAKWPANDYVKDGSKIITPVSKNHTGLKFSKIKSTKALLYAPSHWLLQKPSRKAWQKRKVTQWPRVTCPAQRSCQQGEKTHTFHTLRPPMCTRTHEAPDSCKKWQLGIRNGHRQRPLCRRACCAQLPESFSPLGLRAQTPASSRPKALCLLLGR